jgi:hypothetical protein
MYTSILLVAMAGTQAPFASPAPDWKQDYATAKRECKSAGKPIAVFVGRGADGWSQVSDSGKLGSDVRGLLGENYVCLYLDRDSEIGQKVATALELSADGPGLVISDSAGELQAFRHSGKLSAQRMAGFLRTYADPARVVQHTDSAVRQDVRFYPPSGATASGGGASYGGCPTCGRR